ncbi:MAG: alkaline phosphatase D family protein [Bacteroidetes bacterium]|nr:alkaline phosphatase D family protein [Bacteroidota bacterium]
MTTDLKPNREYWYRFIDEHGFASRIGRTMTAPEESSDAPVRFTFVSCQCPNEGAMNAYRKMIFEDEARSRDQQLNFVLHLGDFIYEVTWYAEDNQTVTVAVGSGICISSRKAERLVIFICR